MPVIDLGLISFEDALAMQLAAVENVRAGGERILYLLEHHPVITFGRRGKEENLLVPRSELAKRGVGLIRTTRGGDVTCHYPGQLVAYPIMRLDRRKGGLRRYFFDLEQVVVSVLSKFGIRAGVIPGKPGVWTDGRKIASIGIGVKSWVTYHGISINLSRDLSLFSLINLCGMADVAPTSVHLETGCDDITMKDLKDVLIEEYRKKFEAA